jgi:hypothetical protein
MIMHLLLGLALVFSASVHASDWQVENAERVVAISDVHGAYDAMVSTLQNAGVLDAELAWAGGTTRLVIVGDILDRGPRSRDAMDLLMRLEDEAQAAGGYVHVLIGNHESMNMIGDLRYVSKEEYAAFADDETDEQRERWFGAYARRYPAPRDEGALRQKFDAQFPAGYFALREAFSSNGKYGKWLLGKPIIAVINGTAFVHGGLSPIVVDYGLDGVNKTLQSELKAYVRAIDTLTEAEVLLPTDSHYDYVDIVGRFTPSLDEKEEVLAAAKTLQKLDRSSLIASDGPLWYRSNVSCSGVIEKHRLDAALAAIGANRLVVGHTPTPTRTVLQRFGGRLVEVDTGMLNFYYKGSGNALVLSGDSIAVYNQSAAEPYTPAPHPRNVGLRPNGLSAEELGALLRNGDVVAQSNDELGRTVVEISDGNTVVNALFARRGARGFYPDAAAYRLDRLLELDMVPVSVKREVDGRDGTLQFLPMKTMDEGARSESGRGRGASCPLQDQFMAMYVFDVLVFNEGRTLNRMLYDTRDWDLMLIEHERAFSTSKGRPRHLAQAPVEVTEGWRAALAALSDEVLQEQLGDVLDKKRLRALAARRDELLAQAASR